MLRKELREKNENREAVALLQSGEMLGGHCRHLARRGGPDRLEDARQSDAPESSSSEDDVLDVDDRGEAGEQDAFADN